MVALLNSFTTLSIRNICSVGKTPKNFYLKSIGKKYGKSCQF